MKTTIKKMVEAAGVEPAIQTGNTRTRNQLEPCKPRRTNIGPAVAPTGLLWVALLCTFVAGYVLGHIQ
jgi:hypothetical protein